MQTKEMRLLMKISLIFLIVVLLTTMLGCANMTATQQRVLSGSAIGTAAGIGAAALIGGPLVAGAVTGAAAGAVGGVVVDQIEKAH
jgi:osmotically inducible lipoprotein OsmB